MELNVIYIIQLTYEIGRKIFVTENFSDFIACLPVNKLLFSSDFILKSDDFSFLPFQLKEK